MRVPLSWLHEYVDPGLAAEDLAELLTLAGLEVEAIERPSGGVRGVVVAEVVTAEKIPDTKLTLVEAFDGDRSWEIVCGASNFGPGDRVPAALPGARLPGGIEIGARKLRGHMSNGMLASARELGVGDDHRGIWVLDRDAPLGADLTQWLDLDDPVLVFDITPDRGYALSILGIARDVAALTGAGVRAPEAVLAQNDAHVPVTIDNPDDCHRFDARRIDGVTVGPSPVQVQRRLAAAGIRPISNVVDATNYAMLETGHPAHAYDLRRLAGPRIDVRRARPGERLVTLDGVERALDPVDLVIADADGPVGIAGVMGGARTEVGDATTSVLLEVAAFDPAAVLVTARRLQLFTQASTRFEKTVARETVPVGAARCAALISEFAGGTVTGGVDAYPRPRPRSVIHLQPERARSVLGMPLDAARQAELLTTLGCDVEHAGDSLRVSPPAYRPDLRIAADLYEELARLEGYEQVPESVRSSGAVGGRSRQHDARRAVRSALAGAGWTEVLTFPFIGEEDLAALGYATDDRRRSPVALRNPLSKEEAVLRTTLVPGLLRVLRHNVNRQVTDVAIFEAGHVFLVPTADDPGVDGGPGGVVLPAEPLLLGFAATGHFETRRHDRQARPVDLYDLLGAADAVREAVHRPAFDVAPTDEAPFHPGRAARLRLEGEDVGVVGELHPRVAAAFDVPARTLVGEVRLDAIVARGVVPPQATVPSPLPGLRFDVAVVVADDVPAAAVEAAVRQGAGPRVTSVQLFDVYRGASVGEGRKSLAYTVRLDDAETQLRDADEAQAIDAIAAAVEALGGRLRR